MNFFRRLQSATSLPAPSTAERTEKPRASTGSGKDSRNSTRLDDQEEQQIQSSNRRRDRLYRALYLRREYALVGAVSDVVLLPPASESSGLDSSDDAHSGGADDAMMSVTRGWSGLVFVRDAQSPWFGGCFAFTVYFPARYPFECPAIDFAEPLSHPLLTVSSSNNYNVLSSLYADGGVSQQRPRTGVAFEEVYCAMDPMRASVMARLLRHMRQLFYPATWPRHWLGKNKLFMTGSPEDRVNKQLARRDVERRSVTQEVVLGKPYVDYLSSDVAAHFLALAARSRHTPPPPSAGDEDVDEGGRAQVPPVVGDAAVEEDEAVTAWSAWYARSLLPHVLQLQ